MSSKRLADDQDQTAPSGPNKKPRINSPGKESAGEPDFEDDTAPGSTFAEAGGDATAGDDDDDEVQVQDQEEDDEDEDVVADGEDFERRRDRELQDEMRAADREKMVAMLRYFTPEQMDRYECFRRSSLPKPVLRRLFQTITGTMLNPNGLIVLSAVGKMFVGELVETARHVADEEGVSDLEELKPVHIREAHRRLEVEGKLFRGRKKALFAKNLV